MARMPSERELQPTGGGFDRNEPDLISVELMPATQQLNNRTGKGGAGEVWGPIYDL
jgi:hypothetical protein